jgi:broad specificity phosphatase PhoE
MNDETDISIRDPGLSPKGEQQCKDFSDAFKGQENHIDCILASPMTRVLQTACSAFKEVIKPTKGGDRHAVIAMPQLQNLDSGINGTGLDPDELADRYNGVDWDRDRSGLPRGWVDTSFVQEGRNVKETGKWSAEEVQWRLEYIRIFLQVIWVISGAGRCKTEVVIVTHGSLLRKLVNDRKLGQSRTYVCTDSLMQ